MRNLLIALLFVFTVSRYSMAQEFEYDFYDWTDDRKPFQLSDLENKEPAIFLKDLRAIEFAYDKDGNAICYYTLHKIIKVNTDESIQEFNKVYISLYNTLDILDLKVRAINTSGKITYLDKSNIKEVKSEDTPGYKIFAVEGVEKGSEIEYLYKLKKNYFNFSREYFQSIYKSKDATFELISPENLVFDTKGYNGFPVLKDTVVDSKRFLSAKGFSVTPKTKEEYSFYRTELMRVEYKLGYNTSRGKTKIFTWANAGERVYGMLSEGQATYNKQVQKIISKNKLNGISDTRKRIKAIENYIKNNYLIVTNGPAPSELGAVLKSKTASTKGIVMLFMNFFNNTQTNYSIVLTTNRSELKFDPEFESWDFLENYLFYFPEINEYLAPSISTMRMPMIPYNWAHNHGLFIKPVTLGGYSTAVGEVKFIEAFSCEKNTDWLDLKVKFVNDMEKAEVHVKKKLGGYNAIYIQPYYSLLDEENKKKISEELLKTYAKGAQVSNIKVANFDKDLCPLEVPFELEGDLTSETLIEKAGNKYIFKIGEIIGPQVEMYQEKKRVAKVENTYNRSYIRHIELEIPEGYKVVNLKDLNMDISFGDDKTKTMAFISKYKQEGNVVVVDVEEYYKNIIYEVEEFENFRKVINAAADFNKISLVLEKE
ncbi:MAG TPA: DUF3857 domain-containing protein [Cytophagaceae bacterium]